MWHCDICVKSQCRKIPQNHLNHYHEVQYVRMSTMLWTYMWIWMYNGDSWFLMMWQIYVTHSFENHHGKLKEISTTLHYRKESSTQQQYPEFATHVQPIYFVDPDPFPIQPSVTELIIAGHDRTAHSGQVHMNKIDIRFATVCLSGDQISLLLSKQ